MVPQSNNEMRFWEDPLTIKGKIPVFVVSVVPTDSQTSYIILTPVKYPSSAPGMSSSIQDNCPCRRWLQFPPGQPEGSFSINGGIIGSLSVNGNKICLFSRKKSSCLQEKGERCLKQRPHFCCQLGLCLLGRRCEP